MAASSSRASSVTSLANLEFKPGDVPKPVRALPALKRTGNFALDSEQERAKEELSHIITECMKNIEHISPLYSVLQKRLKSSSDPSSAAGKFEKISVLNKLPAEYIMEHLVAVSDCNQDDFLEMLKYDPDVLTTLLCMDQQLPATFKLPKCCIFREVMTKMLGWRSELVGKRLATLKASGGILGSGRINWKIVGSYSLEFEGDKLQQVKHTSGDVAVIPGDITIGRDWKLHDNFLDFAASLVKEPLPPFKLSVFFQSTTGEHRAGPFAVQVPTAKVYEQKGMTFQQEYMDKLAGLQVPLPTNETAAALNAITTERRAAGLKRARENAQAAISKRKAKRTTSLT